MIWKKKGYGLKQLISKDGMDPIEHGSSESSIKSLSPSSWTAMFSPAECIPSFWARNKLSILIVVSWVTNEKPAAPIPSQYKKEKS